MIENNLANKNALGADPVEQIRQERNQEPAAETQTVPRRHNPRLVFTNPDDYFNRFYSDLLMEQQEQQ